MFLQIQGIQKSFGAGDSRVDVLKGLDLDIERGEFCVLLGPSGSGKSTLLNIIGGIDSADEGNLVIDGERLADISKIIIEKNAQSISMVKILGYTNGEISKLYIMSTSLVVVFCLLLSLPLETVIMKVLFREMMLSSISGWITLWIDPMIYVQMFAAGIITYGIVALLEFRRVKKVPMDEALKNVE